MKKLLSGIAAVAVVVAACGGAGDIAVAAKVDDVDITVGEVRSLPYEASSSIDASTFARYLGALIQWQIVETAAEADYGVAPTEAEVEAELETVLAEQSPGQTLAEVAEAENFSEETIRRLVGVGLVQRQIADQLLEEVEEPTADEVDAAREEALVGLTEVCVRHVLVATEDEAVTAKERLDGGEDFATLAGEISTDPSAAENGGDLGCAPAGQYVPEFRDAAVTAEIDEVTDPVPSTYGFHVLQVYERTEPADEDIPTDDEISQALKEDEGATQLQDWLLTSVESASVTVDEEYGSWTVDPQPAVVPPET